MNILLHRIQLTPEFTIGRLLLAGKEFCWVCEDTVRPPGEKVKGKTAIPTGRYQIKITMSPRFQVMMPLLLNVPMFEGIRIHPGNTAVDTDGCLLPGFVRMEAGVGESRKAYRELYNQLAAEESRGRENWIDIQ